MTTKLSGAVKAATSAISSAAKTLSCWRRPLGRRKSSPPPDPDGQCGQCPDQPEEAVWILRPPYDEPKGDEKPP